MPSSIRRLIRLNRDAVLAKEWDNNRSVRRSWLSIRWFIFLDEMKCWVNYSVALTFYSVPAVVNLCCPHPLLYARVFLLRHSSFVSSRGSFYIPCKFLANVNEFGDQFNIEQSSYSCKIQQGTWNYIAVSHELIYTNINIKRTVVE